MTGIAIKDIEGALVDKKTKFDFKRYFYGIIDAMFNDLKTLSTGNLSHRKPSIMTDLVHLKGNLFLLEKEITQQGEVRIGLDRDKLINILTKYIGWDEIGITKLADAIIDAQKDLFEVVK